MPLTDYLTQMQAAFSEAVRFQSVCEHTIQIADLTIRLRFAGPALEPMVLPALAHLEKEDIPGSPKITFHLWDAATTGVNPPRPPFASDDYHRYGQRAIWDDGQRVIMHTPTMNMLYAYDRTFGQGFFWCDDATQLSIYEQAAPLQTLFHWAMGDYGWQIVHGATVGTEKGGVLIVGNTGAGKSTTALSVLKKNGIGSMSDLLYLSDDKCLIRLDPEPRAFGLYNSAKLKADMLDSFPYLQPLIAGWDGEYKAGKSLAFLHPDYSARMLSSCPLKAILIPRVAHYSEPRLSPAPSIQAFRVLGPSTVIWLPGAETNNYHFTAELTRRLPCYILELALDPTNNLVAIQDTLERHK